MKKLAQRRGAGRPAGGSSRDAREALLDAAVVLFAERGVAASTASAIAARARVTPAMVHYYFLGRQQLIDAVVDERIAHFIRFVFDAPLDPTGSVGATVAAIAARIFEAARQMPWMPPIWIREIAAGGGLLRERALCHVPAAEIAKFVERIAAEQRRRSFAKGIEPRLVFVSMIGLTMFPIATQPAWRALPGADTITLDALERHAIALLTAGLANAAPSRARRKR